MVEIDVPEGMQVSAVRSYADNALVRFSKLPPTTKWRPPTKLDLLTVDSIPVRIRKGDDWVLGDIRAVATCGKFRYVDTKGFTWDCAEIEVPVDEQPPREAWVRYIKEFENPWGNSYGDENSANNMSTEGVEVLHMIEVPSRKELT